MAPCSLWHYIVTNIYNNPSKISRPNQINCIKAQSTIPMVSSYWIILATTDTTQNIMVKGTLGSTLRPYIHTKLIYMFQCGTSNLT